MPEHGFGGDFHADSGGDFHADAGGLHDAFGHADSGGPGGQDGHEAPPQDVHGSSWLFAMISFRTVIAAMAFFGLAGLAAEEAGVSPPAVLGLAIAAGAGAMYGVYWMMQCLYRLRSDGTVRVRGAVGRQGTVYLRIPAERSGMGKILINLQNRTIEYDAMTSGKELPTGTEVVVVNLISSSMLEVQAVPELERNIHV